MILCMIAFLLFLSVMFYSSTEFIIVFDSLIVLFVMTFHLKLFRILTINAESNQLLSGILFTE